MTDRLKTMSRFLDRLEQAIDGAIEAEPDQAEERYPRTVYRARDYSPVDATLQSAIRAAFRAAWNGGTVI